MHRMVQPDPFADEGPVRALAASTIKQRTSMLKRLVSELLRAGVLPGAIDCVAAVCAPDMAKLGLQSMVARNGNKSGVVTDNMASSLLACARSLDWTCRGLVPLL